jgi:hypothetical protein
VHCGCTLEQHQHSSGRAVFWCPGDTGHFFMAQWHVDAGWCVHCGWPREDHYPKSGQCKAWVEHVFTPATPGYPQMVHDSQTWDEAAESMRQALTYQEDTR